MLVLSRKLAVRRSDRPLVLLPYHDIRHAQVDHRLDGEDHSWPHDRACFWRRREKDRGFFVKLKADSVSGELADHTTVQDACDVLNGGADVPKSVAWENLCDAGDETAFGGKQDVLRLQRLGANAVHRTGVPEVTVQNRCHVNVQNVPLLQGVLPGDSVTDDLVDR